MAKKLKVLGVKYSLAEKTQKEDPELDCAGYVLYAEKKIVIDSEIPVDYMKRKVIRHEIVHAFLHESGMSAYSQDEDIVEWIAAQAPKLFKTFQEVGAM